MKRPLIAIKSSMIVLVLLISCASSLRDKPRSNFSIDPDFNQYWYQGKAEVTSYTLNQARYGEIHEGKAVLVFVTEDFSSSKGVKLDNPSKAGKDAVSILKLNMTKKFNTGVYPYSMMQSVFTPININEYQHSIKSTTSSQEWCGHTFTQMNLKGNKYSIDTRSYFESEGDTNVSLVNVLLEDEVWARIRISPESLPTGLIDIIPAAMSQRLRHTKMQIEKAQASLKNTNGIMTYRLDYPTQDRTISIRFEQKFPYKILGWEETYVSGWGKSAKKLTTTANIDKQILSNYWNRNSNADNGLRKELNLD